MDTSQNRHALFHSSNTVSDKLNLFQSLLDSKDLTSDQALALLNVIRSELEKPQRNDPSSYRQYVRVMGSLHAQMPDVYEQIAMAWQQKRVQKPALMQEPVKVPVEAEEGLDEPESAVGEQVQGEHNTTERAEPKETLRDVGEHEEHEEEREEESAKEENEKEEELEKDGAKEAEEQKNEEKEKNEEENQDEEEKPEEEVEEKEPEPQEESKPEGEEESQEEAEEEPEVGETEPDGVEELEVEAGQEATVEDGEISESSSEGGTEAESAEESHHMATEAGEAAAEMEHEGVEITEETESPEMEEEEPPVEGGE